MGYTYLIGWSHLDKWYYGVRFAKGCSIGDLWTKYFTSSNRVKKFRDAHGEPDVVEVRQVFATRKCAQEWERRVLVKMKAVRSPRWLNANDTFRYDAEQTPEMIEKRRAGVQRSWDTLSRQDREARLARRREGWAKQHASRDAPSRDRFIALSMAKLAAINSQPLEIRVANSQSGWLKLQEKIAAMSEDARKSYYENHHKKRIDGFSAMTPEEKASWAAKKRKTQLAKTDEEKLAFRQKISAIKKAQWAAKKGIL